MKTAEAPGEPNGKPCCQSGITQAEDEKRNGPCSSWSWAISRWFWCIRAIPDIISHLSEERQIWELDWPVTPVDSREKPCDGLGFFTSPTSPTTTFQSSVCT